MIVSSEAPTGGKIARHPTNQTVGLHSHGRADACVMSAIGNRSIDIDLGGVPKDLAVRIQ
jgi:hypothetical protein